MNTNYGITTTRYGIVIPDHKVNELLMAHDASEKRLERAIEKGNSKYEDVYRAECLAYERVLTALGIDWEEK